MKRKIKPCGYRVLVKLKKIDEAEEVKSAGGIITEVRSKSKIDLEQQATQEAYVIGLGPTAFKAYDDGEPWVKEGDCVVICKYSGDDRKDIEEGEVYRIINDNDIQAVFPEEGLK